VVRCPYEESTVHRESSEKNSVQILILKVRDSDVNDDSGDIPVVKVRRSPLVEKEESLAYYLTEVL